MGLGTGRRGMKSPPLLIAVLLACVFVLGINYWITSSRCVELQNRVMDLEGRMRRAAAERGAVEMKKNEYEDMLAKQKKQIDTIQSLHSSQMQNVHSVCNNEKENLLNNMTAQIVSLQKRLEECRLELKGLQESQTKKLSYELAQCINKVKEAKEQCEERLRKAALKEIDPVNPNVDKIVIKPSIKQEVNQQDTNIKEEAKSKSPVTPTLSLLAKDKKDAVAPPAEAEEKAKEMDVLEKKPSAAPKQEKQEKEDDDQGPVNEVNPNLGNAEDDDEPKAEDVIDKDVNKENEEVDRENLLNLEGQQEDGKEEKPAEQEEEAENGNEYIGEDTNVAEPEAEKQAQLIDNDQNLKDEKIQNGLNGQVLDPEVEDSEDPPVK